MRRASHWRSFCGNCRETAIGVARATHKATSSWNGYTLHLDTALGDGPVALMRGHGNLVVAPNIKLAVQRALYTEVNAQQLVTALSFRRPITYIAPDESQDPKRLDDAWEVWKRDAMKDA